MDCTGCGACVNNCPGNNKNQVLPLGPIAENEFEQKYFDYAVELSDKPDVVEHF